MIDSTFVCTLARASYQRPVVKRRRGRRPTRAAVIARRAYDAFCAAGAIAGIAAAIWLGLLAIAGGA